MDIDNLELGNPNTPHRAVIIIAAEVHELLLDGSCRGNPVKKAKKILHLDGQDRAITINKLEELIMEIVNKCQK